MKEGDAVNVSAIRDDSAVLGELQESTDTVIWHHTK